MLILVIAAFLLGPERLPRYAEALAGLVRRVRDFAQGARTRMKDEMGDEFDDVDWRQLDPRQYDPRRIIREALLDDPPVPAAKAAKATTTAAPAVKPVTSKLEPGTRPPFDSEAT
ncbi:MAG: Sec-independent protein translocase TatB [Microbacterium sp.]|mgnify:FL=1|nr:Sec-independent protein translocase TatB [Microbacterium sp.]MAM55554.1 Sec-independent protein translocase TatB [Microbacterium sp.]MAY49207.1 Sec-independent protein translocase TatB [Microbacterium sp.]HAS32142.1 Sec-independent protein translocase TatB [Microbacterium sp.]HBR90209.1 Sec-independent protein translocase TatB [Microbacterium sp.]